MSRAQRGGHSQIERPTTEKGMALPGVIIYNVCMYIWICVYRRGPCGGDVLGDSNRKPTEPACVVLIYWMTNVVL